ncbi:hypothetical protein ACEWK1_06045, partial [Metabacillus sp. YM-086]
MFGYKENRDRKRVGRRVYVSIQGESGHKTSIEKGLCLDTRRIGTETRYREEFMSRYKENRDRKRVQGRVYVSIQGESGQKTSCEKSLCLDTRRIGTENEYREGFMSRYKENRDRKR